MSQRHHWVVVVSHDHALTGVEQGIIQANHGKQAPMRRMQPGDYVVLYAAKRTFGGREPYQRFVAAGEVEDRPVYQAKASACFHPYRRAVRYWPTGEAAVRPLIPDLRFVLNKQRWGYPFRAGFFAIPATDFALIHAAMLSDHA
jgi:hypothetical protein